MAGGFRARVNTATPSLKYYALGVWLTWSFNSYNSGAWGGGAEAPGPEVTYFISTIALLLTVVLMMASKAARDTLTRRDSLIMVGGLATVGAFVGELIDPAAASFMAVFGIAAALTGFGSAVIILKICDTLADIPPSEVFFIVSKNAILVFLSLFVLKGVAPVVALSIKSCTFFAAGLLLSLEDGGCRVGRMVMPKSSWRVYTIFALLFFILAIEDTCFRFYGTAEDVSAACAHLTLVAIVVVAALLLITRCSTRVLDAYAAFYPIVVGLVAAFSFAAILGPSSMVGVIIAGVFKLLLLVHIYTMCAYLAYRTKTPLFWIVAVSEIASMTAEMLGRLVPMAIPSLVTDFSLRAVMVITLIVLFFIALTVVLPKERLMQMFTREDVGEDADRAPADALPRRGAAADGDAGLAGGPSDLGPDADAHTFGPAGWRQRCAIVGEMYGLTERERDVLLPLTHGHSANRISDDLFLSYYTVRAHTRNIYSKTGVHSRQELIELVESVRIDGQGR